MNNKGNKNYKNNNKSSIKANDTRIKNNKVI